MAAGQRIKERREQLGLTQMELGARVGLKTSTAKHEQGAYGFRGETLAAFAAALGVSERWILFGEDGESKVEKEWLDAPGWTELEREGAVDRVRALGVPEEQIQHVRRTPGWKGGGTADDYRRLLDDLLVSRVKRRELPESEAARARRRPDLKDLG